MAQPVSVLTETVSADGQSSNFRATIRNTPEITWVWTFTISGTGANSLKLQPQIPLNYETPGATQVYSDLDNTRAFDWPLWVTSDMIDDAGGTLRYSLINPNAYSMLRLDYDWVGAGSREITVQIQLAA